MVIRPATEADESLLGELWHELSEELDDPYPDDSDWEQAWPDVRETLRDGVGFVAEENGGPLGFTLATLAKRDRPFAHVTDIYVRPEARRSGVAKALLAAVVGSARERGLPHVSLDVSLHNTGARAAYERLGFTPVSQWFVTDTEQLARRFELADRPPSFGSIHVQTDDERSVGLAVERYLPRLGRSGGTIVSGPQNGWIAIYDQLCDRDREAQRRFAAELSDRLGAVAVAFAVEEGAVVRFCLYERGRMVDEYLSVPTYYGPIERVEELQLAANPTLLARLTGAEAARVRAVARTAATPSELPPAGELLGEIAELFGISGAGRATGSV